MFRTGLGKSVAGARSSVGKALSVLGGDYENEYVQSKARENGCNLSNSLFQTGSGKMVSLSLAGLTKAKTLLSWEHNDSDPDIEGIVTTTSRRQSSGNVTSGGQKLSHIEARNGVENAGTPAATLVPMPSISSKVVSVESELRSEAIPNLLQFDVGSSVFKPAPIKFSTAGGRSISISSDALQRARSLLGDPESSAFSDEGNLGSSDLPSVKSKKNYYKSFDRKYDPCASVYPNNTAKSINKSKSFISPLRSASHQRQSSLRDMHSGDNLIKKFEAEDPMSVSRSSCEISCTSEMQLQKSLGCGSGRVNQQERSSVGALCDISNTIGMGSANTRHTTIENRRLQRSSISPFKRPRSSKFSTSSNGSTRLALNGIQDSCRKRKFPTRYPSHGPRMYMKDYFGSPPSHYARVEKLPDHIKWMKADAAEKYNFCDESGRDCIGVEAFCQLLAQSGASMQCVSKEWVANHYKWVVWKLACYERGYPSKCTGKFLSVANVLEELKYRYEREVNHGHRSAIKRLLEGSSLPSLMMVLCIASIHFSSDPKTQILPEAMTKNTDAVKVELTDGWYSIDALLDPLLSKQLASGKLYVGQKLRIWGAGLCGWVGPISPLEVPRAASLLLHMNGTYRAHWADRMGLCKGVGAPLALRCIKGAGGPVPLTLVGVKRIYPVLFKERLKDGGYVVRSVRMETRMMQLYSQRCFNVVDGINSEFQRGKEFCIHDNNDSEEGAKIFKMLETAAEPEVLMAEMTSEQLTSFATYKEKLEVVRQSEMQISAEKALENAGLRLRDVTPFMRVRVVGLTSRSHERNGSPREGLITIWNPTDKQKFELVEGQAYAVPGLVPMGSDSHTLYLQSRGTSTRWKPLSACAIECFKPFFCPRISTSLSNLGEVPLSSEFDIAGFIVYVGEVYTAIHQKKQWVFVTDGSISSFQSEDLSSSLLAINFFLPCGEESLAPINQDLAGSTVGFCNIVKRAKDHINHLWVAEAAENSTYVLSYESPCCAHLKNAAAAAERWAKVSSSTIENLKEKVLFIIGSSKG